MSGFHQTSKASHMLCPALQLGTALPQANVHHRHALWCHKQARCVWHACACCLTCDAFVLLRAAAAIWQCPPGDHHGLVEDPGLNQKLESVLHGHYHKVHRKSRALRSKLLSGSPQLLSAKQTRLLKPWCIGICLLNGKT